MQQDFNPTITEETTVAEENKVKGETKEVTLIPITNPLNSNFPKGTSNY